MAQGVVHKPPSIPPNSCLPSIQSHSFTAVAPPIDQGRGPGKEAAGSLSPVTPTKALPLQVGKIAYACGYSGSR